MIVFFVFKQKTAYEMRISDWSSDGCSSDLLDMMSVSGRRRRQFRRRGHVFGWGGGGFADKRRRSGRARIGKRSLALLQPAPPPPARGAMHCKQRSEERRVGKECVGRRRSRGSLCN